MRQPFRWLVGTVLKAGLLGGSMGSVGPVAAQSLEPPAGCLGNYGNTACAALIYSQMVCEPYRAAQPKALLDQQLANAFQAAGLSTAELQVDAVVSTALTRFIPAICPQQLNRLQRLQR